MHINNKLNKAELRNKRSADTTTSIGKSVMTTIILLSDNLNITQT